MGRTKLKLCKYCDSGRLKNKESERLLEMIMFSVIPVLTAKRDLLQTLDSKK